MSLVQRGKKASPETRAKMSASRLGFQMSEEAKRKLSTTKTGKPMHPDTKAILLASNLGARRSEEVKANMREAQKLRRQREAGLKNTPVSPVLLDTLGEA